MKNTLDCIKKHWLVILLGGTCVLLALIISIMYGKMFCLPVKQIDNQERIHRLEQKLAEALERANKAASNSRQVQKNLVKLKQLALKLNSGIKQTKPLGQQNGQQNLSNKNMSTSQETSKSGIKLDATTPVNNNRSLTDQDLDTLEDALNGINVPDGDVQQSQPERETSHEQEQQNMGLGSAASTQCTDQPCIATGGVQSSNNTQATTTSTQSTQNKLSEDTTRQYKDLQDMSQKIDQRFAQMQATFMEQQAKETRKHCEQTINDSLKKSLSATLG